MFRVRKTKRARMPLLSETYGEWCLAIQHLAETTRSYYTQTVGDFLHSFSDRPCDKLLTKDIRTYISQRLWKNQRSSTNKEISAIRSFGLFLSESYHIENPAEKIRKFKPEIPRQPFINRTQYEKILASAKPLEADVIRLLSNSGLRSKELADLRFDNISENFSSIRFVGKGGKERSTPLNATMREILSRHIQHEIINLPKSRRYIYQLCSNAGKRAEIYLAPHMLRRFFASQLVEKGISLLIVSRLLGHASVSQTEKYLKIDSSFLHGVTDVLD